MQPQADMPFPSFMTELFTRRFALALCCAVPLLFGFYANVIEQDANWDLKNYHWYNAYAFLTDRLLTDVQPAQIPTYYNPTLDVPFFVLAQALPARAVAFVLGAVQGLNYVLLYLIALRVFAPMPVVSRRGVALVLAAVGLTGGGHLGLAGTTFYDNIVSLFVLGSIWLAVTPQAQIKHVIGAGVLVGLGVGLKLPTVVFAVGLCAAFLCVGGSFRQRFTTAFVFGLGVIAGFAVFAGHWTLHLWTAYANPIFPYFNSVFDSPMALAASYRDTRFVPEGFMEALFFPLVVAWDPMQAGEIVFRDWRIAAAFCVLALTPVMLWLRPAPLASASDVDRSATHYVLAAAGLSYLVWLGLFGIYRYLIPIEMLAPLMIAAVVALWPVGSRPKLLLSAAIMTLLVVSTQPGTWGRVPFGEKFVAVSAPVVPDPARTLVLMAGNAPTAWVIPAFAPETVFVRIQGFGNHPDDGDTGINHTIRTRIAQHDGDFYMLAADYDRAFAQAMLARYGLTLIETDCRPIQSNLASWAELCAVRRGMSQDESQKE